MPGGIRGQINPSYSQTEYAQTWGGIDVSKPSSQIDPGSAVSFNGSIVRGALENGAALATIASSRASTVVTLPTFASTETILNVSNLDNPSGQFTYIITNLAVYSDFGSTGGNKTFVSIYTIPSGGMPPLARVGTIVIGPSLYFSSCDKLGVYKITGNTVTEISDHGSGSGPFIGGGFLFTIGGRLCLWNVIGGDGNQNTPTPSTNTQYPDRVAWSFSSAFGFFDPNSALEPGGFQQITEARGLGTGVAVFEAVAMLAHNGGFTEMVPNLSVNPSIPAPFTFAPLWSSDQGVVCRFGSMAQYGSMCCFLGIDQPYQLSPSGLTPFGSKVASLLQNYYIWDNAAFINAGFIGLTGLFGSIVEIEGEKHYLISFSADGNGSNPVQTIIYDCCLSSDSWSTHTLAGVAATCPIYQSYDITNFSGIIIRDSWLLFGYDTNHTTPYGAGIQQILLGQQLFSASSVNISSGFNILFRAETPEIFIPQITRRLLVEYENLVLPSYATPTTITCTFYGQATYGGFPAQVQTPSSQTFTMSLNYFAPSSSIPQNAVLTTTSEPVGTAFTATATSLQLVTTGPIRLIRAALVADTVEGDIP